MRNRQPKIFVTPGVLAYNQYGTTGRYGNGGGGGSGYPWTPLPWASSQSTIFTEPWGEYASGEPSVVTAAKWTWSAATNMSILNGLNQISYASNTTPTSIIASTAAQTFNAAKGWSISFELAVALGSSSTNNLEFYGEDDGTGNVGFGVIIQSDNLDGNLNATLRAANANVGVNTVIAASGIGDNLFRLAVDKTSGKMTLFLNGTQVLQGTPGSIAATGSKKVTMLYVQSGIGNHGDIGPVTFKAFVT